MTERTAHTIKEAARVLDYSTDAIYKAINTGQGALAEALRGRWQRDNKKRLVIYLDDETVQSARRQPMERDEMPPLPPPSSADQRLIDSLSERLADRDAQIVEMRTRAEKAEEKAEAERARSDRLIGEERARADAERARLTAVIEGQQREITRLAQPQPGLLARLFGR